MASGQSAPPVHTSSSDARSYGATSSEWARLCSIAGAPFHSVTRSSRIHPATPDRVGAVHHDRRPARLRRQERREHVHVEDGEGEAVALAELGSVAALSHERCGGEQQVVLAVHRALRASGGAAGVGDTGGGEGIDVDTDGPVVGRVERRLPGRQVEDPDAGVGERLGRQQQGGPAVGELPARSRAAPAPG